MPGHVDKDTLVNRLKERCTTIVKERWFDDYVYGYSAAISDIMDEPRRHTTVVIAMQKCWRMMKTMNKIDWTKIANAVEVIKMGLCNRCDVDGVIVYKCGTVIRIDIKGQFE